MSELERIVALVKEEMDGDGPPWKFAVTIRQFAALAKGRGEVELAERLGMTAEAIEVAHIFFASFDSTTDLKALNRRMEEVEGEMMKEKGGTPQS